MSDESLPGAAAAAERRALVRVARANGTCPQYTVPIRRGDEIVKPPGRRGNTRGTRCRSGGQVCPATAVDDVPVHNPADVEQRIEAFRHAERTARALTAELSAWQSIRSSMRTMFGAVRT